MSKECTNVSIGKRLSVLNYAFRKSPAEQKELYRQHLRDCSYCSQQARKARTRWRLKGLVNILGGIGLAIVGQFIPFPGAWVLCLTGGVAWIAIGVVRLLSGRA